MSQRIVVADDNIITATQEHCAIKKNPTNQLTDDSNFNPNYLDLTVKSNYNSDW